MSDGVIIGNAWFSNQTLEDMKAVQEQMLKREAEFFFHSTRKIVIKGVCRTGTDRHPNTFLMDCDEKFYLKGRTIVFRYEHEGRTEQEHGLVKSIGSNFIVVIPFKRTGWSDNMPQEGLTLITAINTRL